MSSKQREAYKNSFRDFSVLLPWKYFVEILTKIYKFDMENRSGSSRIFVKDDERFSAHEPHGREPYVSLEDRKKAIRALIRLGDIKE